MANPLSSLIGCPDDINDLSLRLEGELVETATSSDVNSLSLRLEGEIVEAATNRIFKIIDIYIYIYIYIYCLS